MKANQSPLTESASIERNVARRGLTLSVVVVGLFMMMVLIVSACSSSQSAAAPLNTAPTPNTATPVPTATDPAPMSASPALGPETAPVTIVEYSDFGCPTCWYWYKLDVLNQLRAKYGDQIRFVWRDFPVITLLSPKAAEAGQCANEQGKFWEFHDTVYQNEGAIEASNLQAYAAKIGLNMAQFNDCVTSRRYRDRVNAEQGEGFDRGLRGTPEFFVNGQHVVGPQPLSTFEGIIDPLLAAKK